MPAQRAIVAANPLLFGRGRTRLPANTAEQARSVSDDLKFFATTFAAGFLFVSILIA